jgi:Ca2+-binding RTX toxin-like protein
VTEQANEGTDTVEGSLTYTLGANVENLTLTGAAAINGTGNLLDNTLMGNSAANILTGGAGNDTYVVSAGDSVVEQADQGLDTVQSDVTWTLGANFEALTLTGMANINGTGNARDNLLTGNSGANVLTGGAGNDVYVIGAGDTVVEGATAGTDTILSGVTTTLSANVELLGLTGIAAINGTGNSLNNVLTGNNAANVLDGGAGADTLAGLDGNDTYHVDNTGDLVIELANNGTDLVQSSVTYTLAANVENLTLTGTGAINGTGNGSANVMLGNRGANVLSGAAGDDSLRGGLGNDTLNGSSGNEMYLFGRGEGQDLVQDNSGTADKLLYDAGINPLDLVISRQANDLRLTIHGSSDRITVQNWYVGTTNRIETIQAGNSQRLLSTQVDQLIQAMAGFTTQTGLTWDQGIDQQPAQVQSILATSWQ